MPSGQKVAYPKDPTLKALPDLLDQEWVWQAYRRRFGVRDPFAHITLRQVNHSLGRRALVTYDVEWLTDAHQPLERVTLSSQPGRPVELFRYPHDPYLPGLPHAADPETAHRLIGRHVLTFPARRTVVEMIRYRPADRAVLRHRVGRVTFYVRVMRPVALPPLFGAAGLLQRSGFVTPRIAGRWDEGATVWLSAIPGRNLRRLLRRGRQPPDPETVLSGLESLWQLPGPPVGTRLFNLRGRYLRAKRLVEFVLSEEEMSRRALERATRLLDPFVSRWRPTGVAHNDFYDDQMIVLEDGRIALVDFEEAGAGDPMLDVGNFLAHLNWRSSFGGKSRDHGSERYREAFRAAALERFGWNQTELDLRGAVCLFRICTNPIRRPRPGWSERLEDGLVLVNEVLH